MPSQNHNRQTGRKRNGQGQSIIETVVGGVILVPIVLAIIDLAVVVLGGEICNDLAKQAARAAANSSNQATATAAVVDVQNHFVSSNTYNGLSLTLSRYDGTPDGLASVQGGVTITLPVPVPFLQIGPNMGVKSQATEAIVGIQEPDPAS
jgi:Flp pilus assembly protein TadG